MIIGSLHLTLHLPESHSLKEKRQIVKSLLARMRNEYGVAAAEVGDSERWQIGELGFACVSESEHHADDILRHVLNAIEGARPDLPVLAADFDFFSPDDA